MSKGIGVACPHCGNAECGCIDTRPRDGYRKRRYRCATCGKTYGTVEISDTLYEKLKRVCELWKEAKAEVFNSNEGEAIE